MTDNNKIFERVGDIIYAREVGNIARTEVSRDYNLLERVKEDKLWGEIRSAAKTNTSLQAALDHAIMIYKLSKEYKDVI
jgi:hypothetical protein